MNDFYLTLPSNNTSAEDNQTNRFVTRLPQKLQLNGKWEVALVEIQYPYSWNNIYGRRGNQLADNWIDITFHNDFLVTLFVPPGYYGNIHELLAAIEYGKEKASESLVEGLKQNAKHAALTADKDPKTNKVTKPELKFRLLERHVKDIKFGFWLGFDETLKRVRCTKLPSKIKNVELSKRMQYMLGFENADIYDDKKTAKYIPDLHGSFYALHIYCNLVEPQIIGNSLAPLLRCVHVEGNHGDIVEKMFNSPHYIPVLPTEIETVDIDVKDDRDQYVPFDFGKTVVKLHFRKRRGLF